MNDKTIKALLIIAIATALLVIGLQFAFIKLSTNMMLEKLVPFMLKFEGGLSRDPSDTASRNPSPWTYKGKTGWHTNKGVTYSSFVGLAKKVGYIPNSKNFFEMPDTIWMGILREGYMKPYPLDIIDHLPRVQAVIITWAWGSGVGGAKWRLARFQKEKMDVTRTSTYLDIVSNFDKQITVLNEREWFNKLCDQREKDFRKMKTFPVHGRGWLRRLAEFRTLFQ